MQATQPLGLADVIRSTIEENICMVNTGPGPDCFESALHILLSAMDKVSYNFFEFSNNSIFIRFIFPCRNISIHSFRRLSSVNT